jgi:hypothetical protein
MTTKATFHPAVTSRKFFCRKNRKVQQEEVEDEDGDDADDDQDEVQDLDMDDLGSDQEQGSGGSDDQQDSEDEDELGSEEEGISSFVDQIYIDKTTTVTFVIFGFSLSLY